MSPVFVDLGAHNGQTLLKASEEFPNCQHYYGVEPVEALITAAREKLSGVIGDRLSLCQCAVDALPAGISYLDVMLYEDIAWPRLGSSLLSDKKLNRRRETSVICLDIDFYFSFIDPEAKIILKLDIEGKEYDVLDRLSATGFLQNRVEKLFVEWHWHKTESISEKRHLGLVSRLNELGYPLTGHSRKDEFWRGTI